MTQAEASYVFAHARYRNVSASRCFRVDERFLENVWKRSPFENPTYRSIRIHVDIAWGKQQAIDIVNQGRFYTIVRPET